MSVENKIKELLTRKGQQLTEADGSDRALVMQGSSQKATFDTMPGLAGAGRTASAKASKDSSKSAMTAVAGDTAPIMQGSSKKEMAAEMEEDDENLGAKSAASVSKDTSLRPTMGSEPQPMQGSSKKASMEKAKYQESSEDEDGEVISEVNIKDELASIFGDDLSEEFRSKATSIFEAAVIARVNSEMETIANRLEEQNAEQLQEYKETLVEKVDSYLNYVVEQWMEENQIAIDNGLRTEITEGFITGLKSLFKESYIDVPEEKYDVVNELTDKVDSLTDQLDESISDNIEISKMYVQIKKAVIFNEEVEGLADTEVDKLKKLVEGVEFESDGLYREKLSVIKENYFPRESKKSAEQTLVEETETAPKNFGDSGVMSKYVQALSRTAKSR